VLCRCFAKELGKVHDNKMDKKGALKLPTAPVFLGGGNSNYFFHPETMGK